MKIGISTASLFPNYYTEDALAFFDKNGVEISEVFFESFCEYNPNFGNILNQKKGKTNVHSIHTLTTQFEPQLFSMNKRAQDDSFKILDGVLDAGNSVGASYYTFHGPARLKKLPLVINYDRYSEIIQKIINRAKERNIVLAHENVHWGYYNFIGFFNEIRKRTNGLKATLDTKQARLSGFDYRDYLNEMNSDIVTVHLSDVDDNGKMCLPLFGTFDFCELFLRLKDVGFNGTALIEAYASDYSNIEQLLESYNRLKELAYKVF